MIITAKFNSTCPECGGYVKAGTRVKWEPGTKATHTNCMTIAPDGRRVDHNGQDTMRQRQLNREAVRVQRQALGGSYRNMFGRRERDLYPEEDILNTQRRRDDAEYEQGLAEGRRYSAEVKIYGHALADRFAMMDEMARYNAGEDY